MWRPRLALAVVCLPLAVLMRWGAPAVDSGAPPRAEETADRPAAPRPYVVPRVAWGADEQMVREPPAYVDRVRAVVVHHTDHVNGYDCDHVPALLRGLQRDHIESEGWDDVGYQYVVDRCGTVYEGRGGDGAHTVRGAHTKGFNKETVGIAALGTFDEGTHVPRAMLDAIAAVAAWQLDPGADPHGRVRLTSTNDASRYPKGAGAAFDVITGHRAGYETDCPGDALAAKLPLLRDETERLRDAAERRRG
ncbi:peptidoglycan recognition protein [Streptomyces sp. DSM 42041]|uniref:Peptidoglycan recognition protein n=1 Tax=Streptomyces hazeniae TaxID=3075538 RepID=A0ABU2NN30_9ACTN|nr:peptidoglycan recognition protein [Streptomyces sp. DSM 42041]MDT0378154.1 peptidoglycan recognition protein [Streptomyces sp. DSM 42041]